MWYPAPATRQQWRLGEARGSNQQGTVAKNGRHNLTWFCADRQY